MRSMTTINTPQDQRKNHGGSCCTTNHDEIARAAFRIYEKHGSQNGQDVRNWLDAEAHVKAMHASTMHGIPPAMQATDPSRR